MVRVAKEELIAQLDALLERASQGEEVLIQGEGEQVFQLMPVVKKSARPVFGSARGKGWMSETFDEPLEDFAEYMK